MSYETEFRVRRFDGPPSECADIASSLVGKPVHLTPSRAGGVVIAAWVADGWVIARIRVDDEEAPLLLGDIPASIHGVRHGS